MLRWVVLLVLLTSAVLTGWVLERYDDDKRVARKTQDHDPDYYMENFVRTAMDAEGIVKDRLRADFMVHYPDDDTSELVQPHMEIYNEADKPWHVVAERAWVGSGNEVVLLYGEVEIWRPGAGGERRIEVLTRDLRVLLQEDYAETDHPATIRSPNTVVNAIGMRANFGRNRIELVDQVRSRHDVN